MDETSSNTKYHCAVCGREIPKEDHDNYEGMCWECCMTD